MNANTVTGQIIRRHRREDDLDLASVAFRMTAAGHSMHPDSLSRMEKGQRRIDMDDLAAAALALGLPLARLFAEVAEAIAPPAEASVDWSGEWMAV